MLREILSIASRYYLPIKVDNNQNKKEISMTEPIFLNPNSYENIKLILNELNKMLGIGEKNEWSYVGCDGPPYVIASTLADEGNYERAAISNGL